jgi:hypothetical protein
MELDEDGRGKDSEVTTSLEQPEAPLQKAG